MSSSILPSRIGPLGLSPAAAGAACCVVSALGYTAANICLRQLSVLDCDPTWAICNKELVSVVVIGPWLAVQAVRGLPTLPWGRALVALVLVGAATQLANAGLQWCLGVVGLAVAIPAMFAFMLTSCALLGRAILGERVDRRSIAALGLLLVSLALLGVGAWKAGQSGELSAGRFAVAAALAVTFAAGIVYAMLSIAIRRCVTGTTRLSAVVLIITSMGVVCLAPSSLYRLGWDGLAQTPLVHYQWMVAAGICNVIAFFAMSKALQLTTVVHANMVNASQVALAAVAGIALFREAPNPWLVSGIVLTIAGIFLMGTPDEQRMVDQHV